MGSRVPDVGNLLAGAAVEDPVSWDPNALNLGDLCLQGEGDTCSRSPQELGMDQPPALGLGQLVVLRRAKCQRYSLGFSREKLPELKRITVDFVLAGQV